MARLTDKGRGIQNMFDTIAPRYDLLNRLLSLGIDRRWRRFAVRQLEIREGARFLDIATGTGDVALEIASQSPASVEIVGEDFTQGMLVLGREKVAQSEYRNRIRMANASCEAIPHPEQTFDGITIAFGIRNVVDRPLGLREMFRVLKPGGRAVILEFSHPKNRFFQNLYYFYFKHILPFIGGLLSKRSAYQYLPDSVLEFPTAPEFEEMMREVGFSEVRSHALTGGIASVFVGVRLQ